MASKAISDLVFEIVAALRRRGAWCIQLSRWPNVPHGTPRIVGSYGGRFLAIEVKAPRGPGPTAAQRRELEALDQTGAITLVARSVCEVNALLDDLDRNPPEILALERLIA